ncbi:efflux RND transporter periplasmic adaptor subunit [Mariniblastus fucicola]|uniref:Multidrug resistance protein MdtA n=1 Tax=Mariniblastus fucicola TaxID=980251 RepID=A0A5B9PC74_9BACT|nr:efflux RND transporter periplasmic adaptor subunit [Mariniblastus fucicola]QEG23089.1 Multidrug resistance protein MdtA precursor [Mariniblastus fucicola]
MSDSELDLSQLALQRQPATPRSDGDRDNPTNRKWLTRYVIPGGLIAGFALLVFGAAGNSLWPKPTVEVVPVIVKRATVQQSGQPLFQAAGWIEPRPTAISVPALAPGVVEELMVVEGQSVSKGEPIARLITIDAEIRVQQAKAELANAEGDLRKAMSEFRAAKIRVEKPVHLQVQVADAKSRLAAAETTMANLPFQIESARAQTEYAAQSVNGKRAAGNAIAGVLLQKAESELVATDANLRELLQRQPSLQKEIAALKQKVSALDSQLELLVEENRQLGEAEAKVLSAEAKRESARLKLQKAKLEFDRNTIRSPIDGRILRLIAPPGTRVSGQHSVAGEGSGAVVEMYDPKRLQVRADVRLEDVPRVQPGQPVEIETASSNQTIKGRVLQSNSTANIQKNTLEVKVELLDPPTTVSPEMLVRTTFLAPEIVGLTDVAQETARLFVPKQLVREGENGNVVWVVDANNRARERTISVREANGDLVLVESGLQPTDKLVSSNTNDLSDGTLVVVSGEDRSIGR